MKTNLWYGLSFGLITLFAAFAAPAQAQSKVDAKHMGVATCASSTCHGRIVANEDSTSALNEYSIWLKYDLHAGAYELLSNKWSARIAKNMGLSDATTAKVCLDCHTDHVPESQRGERFLLSDGIGCEACHGGAENWLDSHYGPNATHAANLQAGMAPTEKPGFTAGLCQSCHLGDEERLVTHEIMAAGHPRLRFEMDTWLANMPPHHVVDDDYRARKGDVGSADRWAAGVGAAASGYLQALDAYIDGRSLMPELSLFDCHACHRPMDTDIRRPYADRRMMPAGTVSPHDPAINMLAAAVSVRDNKLAERIRAGNRSLHRAAAQSAAALVDQAQSLSKDVEKARWRLAANNFNTGERAKLRAALLRSAADGEYRDFAEAEQLFLALQALAAQDDQVDFSRYDRLFKLVDDEQNFSPSRLRAEAKRLLP